jgi:hypothetical protein
VKIVYAFYVCRKKIPSIKTLKQFTQDVQEAKLGG